MKSCKMNWFDLIFFPNSLFTHLSLTMNFLIKFSSIEKEILFPICFWLTCLYSVIFSTALNICSDGQDGCLGGVEVGVRGVALALMTRHSCLMFLLMLYSATRSSVIKGKANHLVTGSKTCLHIIGEESIIIGPQNFVKIIYEQSKFQ